MKEVHLASSAAMVSFSHNFKYNVHCKHYKTLETNNLDITLHSAGVHVIGKLPCEFLLFSHNNNNNNNNNDFIYP